MRRPFTLPAGPHTGSVQTTTDDDRRQPAKQYWPIKQVTNISNVT